MEDIYQGKKKSKESPKNQRFGWVRNYKKENLVNVVFERISNCYLIFIIFYKGLNA